MTIRVVLADDHAVVRKGIRDFLEEEGDIQVVAEAGDGAKVKDYLKALRPDVAVLDIRMPQATGIEVTRWIRDEKLPVGVVILTAFDDDPFVMAALQAGANGYVLKNAEAEEIAQAVRNVAQGKSVLGHEIAQKVIAHLAQSPQPPTPENADVLTEREREILQWAAAGLTNKGIGVKLSISDRTVQGHLASIYAKLEVTCRTEAVTKALHLGTIHLPE